jgi:hypothetical protein
VLSVLGALAGFVTAMTLTPDARADSPEMGGQPYEYKYFFPILGDKAARRGIRFPLPFGLGINYAVIQQDINISDVAIAVNDSEYVDLSKIVKFERVRSNVIGLNARADLWVLPFLNIYGLGLYGIDADTDVTLSEPFAFNAGASQTSYGGGFGVTGAYGIAGFFLTLDANWTWNKVENLDSPVKTFLLTPRVGKRFRIGPTVLVSAWVGAMRQQIESDTSGSMNLSDAIGEPPDEFKEKVRGWYEELGPVKQAAVEGIYNKLQERGDTIVHYKLDKELSDPWNMLIGAEADFSERVQLRMEVGFIGRTQLILGASYRFGLIPN